MRSKFENESFSGIHNVLCAMMWVLFL